MKHLNIFNDVSLYDNYIGTWGGEVVPNVSLINDENIIKYKSYVRTATFEVTQEHIDNNLNTLLNNCSNIENIYVNGILTEPDENNQIVVTEVGTYNVQFEFKTFNIDLDMFIDLNTDKDYPTYGYPLILLNDNFYNNCLSLPSMAFSKLTNVKIPKTVTNIPQACFRYCYNLNDDDILHDNIISIDQMGFTGAKLNNIIIPDSVETIGTYAYFGCGGNIETGQTGYHDLLSLGKSIRSVGGSAFAGLGLVDICSVADELDLNNFFNNHCFEGTAIGNFIGQKSIGKYLISNDNVLHKVGYKDKDNPELIVNDIPSYVTKIGNYAFASGGYTEIIIPDSVTSIGQNAFFYCKSLTSITIPDLVTSIENSTFRGCSNLTSVTIPNSITSIKNQAFQDCTSLSEITCYAMTAPTIAAMTFKNIKSGGVLKVPAGATGYDAWMSTSNYYLGKYGWTIQYI